MFPDARISLRRWSVYAETKIPIPLAITLHNFVAPSLPTEASRERIGSVDSSYNSVEFRERTSSTGSQPFVDSPAASPSKEEEAFRKDRGMWLLHRQPQHTNNLLPQLKLEIITTFGEDSTEEVSPKVIYSQDSPETPSLHPSWEHLDERISVDNLEDWWNQNELYKSMKIKLSVIRKEEEKDIDEDCFLEASLHPSFLERIDLKQDNQNDDDIDKNSLLPPGLPPNAMLVHFSDGSIRCPHNIYQTLKENYDLEPPPIEDFSRFEDDVFATLDHVQQTPQRPRNRSIGSLLDQDHEESKSTAAVSNTTPSRGTNASPDPTSPELRTPPRNASSTSAKAQHQNYPQHKSITFANNEQEIIREERSQEKLELLRLIAEEEKALEDDLETLKAEQLTLTHLVEEVQSMEQDISKVKAELHKQSLKLKKEEILKESQSIKLLRDLRDIYPIAPDSSQRLTSVGIIQSTREPTGGSERDGEPKGYLIRGLRLPMDIYTTTVPEEEVNTSLGYCAHLVFMVAKYLAIPLRHRIFCNGSRSAIELDGMGIFPLFLGRLAARALEREQVDRGARLLGTNVECILTHLNLQQSSSSATHILERLQTILDYVADGKSTTSS